MNEQATSNREHDARTIVRTAADWLHMKGWRRRDTGRWVPTHEFTMYQAALMQKGFDEAEAFEA